MPSSPREKTGRNDLCPCGSGRKYKHCCLNAASAAAETPWAQQRRASDRLIGAMQAFSNRKFMNDLPEAWEDFNQMPSGPPTPDEYTNEVQIFSPYFLFDWDPEPPAPHRRGQPRIGIIARAYLKKFDDELSVLEHQIFHQATTQPVSFYEILEAVPGESLTIRDVLIGGETTIIERKGSQVLRPGDLTYAQVCHLPDVTVFNRMAPIRIQPEYKAEIIELRAMLRRKIAKRNRELDADDVHHYAEDIRTTYLDIRDRINTPPQFVNTDKDPIHFHTLTFEVGSAQVAFDALAPLAWHTSKEELLQEAEIDPDGTLHSFVLSWSKPGNKIHKNWNNTILGTIKVNERSLTADVNSKNRADKLRQEIERRLKGLAIYKSTVAQTPEEALKENRSRPALAQGEDEALPDPEFQEAAEAMMREHLEAWVHQKIPILGGRTPLEAVQDPDGREIVESLLLSMERRREANSTRAKALPDSSIPRRLLNLPSSHAR